MNARFAPALTLAIVGAACAAAVTVGFLFAGFATGIPFALSTAVALVRQPTRIAFQLLTTCVIAFCAMSAIYLVLVGHSR